MATASSGILPSTQGEPIQHSPNVDNNGSGAVGDPTDTESPTMTGPQAQQFAVIASDEVMIPMVDGTSVETRIDTLRICLTQLRDA